MTPFPHLVELEEVSLRIAWPHEAQHFTRWLRDHLDRLAAAIGVPLTLLDSKAIAGGQIADLIARDESDGSTVVVENQLGPGDDSHFGRTVTYAAGLDARTAVWIAERFSPAQLAACRWLSAKGVLDVFAVRLRVVRVEGSALAVVFEVLERPERRQAPPRALKAHILGDFAGPFWAAHLDRHPDEAKASRPVGERCRWRATLPTGLVIGQRVQEHAASVFLRGRYGVKLAAAEAALAPFADRLNDRLGVAVRDDGQGLLAVKTLEIGVADPSNWPRVSTWLRDRATEYDATLRQLVGREARL